MFKRRKGEKEEASSDEVKTNPETPAAIELSAGSEKAPEVAPEVKPALPPPGAPKPMDLARELGASADESGTVKVRMLNLVIMSGVKMEPGQIVEVPRALLLAGSFAHHCEVLK